VSRAVAPTLAALALLAREGSGATAGGIYAVLAYVWSYGQRASASCQASSRSYRVKHIASRLG
jgi:hypothetical protein